MTKLEAETLPTYNKPKLSGTKDRGTGYLPSSCLPQEWEKIPRAGFLNYLDR